MVAYNKYVSAILITLILCLLVTSCSNNEQDVADKHKAKVFTISKTKPFNEEVFSLNLPTKYRTYNKLECVDNKNYYFVDYSNDQSWGMISVNKKSHHVTELASFDATNDLKFYYGYKGNLYIGQMKWLTATECDFSVIEVKEKGFKELYKIKSDGMPKAIFRNDKIILGTSEDSGDTLTSYSLTNKKAETLLSTKRYISKDGRIDGDVITGLIWSNEFPSDSGFCYSICSLQNESIDEATSYKNIDYFYSFKDKESIPMGSRTSANDYIGGSKVFYATYSQPDNDNHETLQVFFNHDGDYIPYKISNLSDDSVEIIGSGFLSDNLLLSYYDNGFFIFNKNDKTCYTGRYTMFKDILEDDEIKALDYKAEILGSTFHDNAFYLTYIKDNRMVIHMLKAK